MIIDVATLYPEMCEAVMGESIIGRARRAGKIEINFHQIRDYSDDRHKRTDDIPYGGGMGMVMKAEPIYKCFLDVAAGRNPRVIYMSPKGRVLTQGIALEMSKLSDLFIICGHFEGIDQRLLEKLGADEISVGDYVLTGGELPALMFIDTVARLCGGVLSSAECYTDESHFNGLLEYPHYTRPRVWEGMEVPETLVSGHHKKIKEFREKKSLEITKKNRPDLFYAENSCEA